MPHTIVPKPLTDEERAERHGRHHTTQSVLEALLETLPSAEFDYTLQEARDAVRLRREEALSEKLGDFLHAYGVDMVEREMTVALREYVA